jgi:hypothetical protein
MTVTNDYLLDRARQAGVEATVLDLGCRDGRFVEVLVDSGLKALTFQTRALPWNYGSRAPISENILFF